MPPAAPPNAVTISLYEPTGVVALRGTLVPFWVTPTVAVTVSLPTRPFSVAAPKVASAPNTEFASATE